MDFADLWLQDLLSDAEVVLKVASEDADGARKRKRDEEETGVLRRFPAHKALRWQEQQQQQGSGQDGNQQQQADAQQSTSCVTYLTLDSADQEPAAMAVLAAVYGAKAIASAELSEVDLLRVVLIADMLQVSSIAETAVQLLCDIARSAAGISAQLQKHLLQLKAWPACLRPVFPVWCAQHSQPLERLAHAWIKVADVADGSSLEEVEAAPYSTPMRSHLLSKLQNLQRVWEDQELQRQLLALPLPAMQLLLASNRLEVPNEDLVLFTAGQYVQVQPTSEQSQAAKQQLASLIRCPHLSSMWLTDVLTSADPSENLLGCYLQHVRTLVGMRQLPGKIGQLLRAPHLKKLFDGAPASWFLRPRTLVPEVDHVEVTWVLPVKDLKDACIAAYTHDQHENKKLFSPTATAPLYGVSFKISVVCSGNAEGTTIGLGLKPNVSNRNMFVAVKALLFVNDKKAKFEAAVQGASLSGVPDYFLLGSMAGGWDDTAWANKGLPAAGNLEVKLTVAMDKPL